MFLFPSMTFFSCKSLPNTITEHKSGRTRRPPWFSVFLRTPEPYFGEVSHLHAVSVPPSMPGDSLSLPHRPTGILFSGGILDWVQASWPQPCRHPCCADFLCSLTCSVVPLTSHVKYKFKDKIINNFVNSPQSRKPRLKLLSTRPCSAVNLMKWEWALYSLHTIHYSM